MIEVVKNEISDDGMKCVRFVSDQPMCADDRPGRTVKTWKDDLLGLHYLEMTYPLREVITMKCDPKDRKFVAWKLMPGERVSEIIPYIAEWYFINAHHRPQYAFMRKLPKGVESGTPIALRALPPNSQGTNLGEEPMVYLIEAEWALSGCILIGG